jgi:hypothetical protein
MILNSSKGGVKRPSPLATFGAGNPIFFETESQWDKDFGTTDLNRENGEK